MFHGNPSINCNFHPVYFHLVNIKKNNPFVSNLNIYLSGAIKNDRLFLKNGNSDTGSELQVAIAVL
jgi:hypothetical protein